MTALFDRYGPGGTERGVVVPEGTILDCGDPVPHVYKPNEWTRANFAQVLASPSRATCVCGKSYTEHGVGTGYAGTSDKRMICYRHAEAAEAQDFAAAGEAGEPYGAYVTEIKADDPLAHWVGQLHVTTWTGRELAREIMQKRRTWCRHGRYEAFEMRRVVVQDETGRRWWGVYNADGGEYVTLRPYKSQRGTPGATVLV